MVDLRYCFYKAADIGEALHPQKFMADLGISYVLTVPQSVADQWWFLGCSDVPDPIPSPLSLMVDFDPMQSVGYGLDKEMARKLLAARALP